MRNEGQNKTLDKCLIEVHDDFKENSSNNGIEFLRTDERHECSDSESTNPKEDK